MRRINFERLGSHVLTTVIWVVLGFLFVITAILSAAEMATFSARPERMRQAMDAGDSRGTLVLVYQRSPVSFLAAGQVIATAVALGTGAVMQVEVTPLFSQWLGSLLSFSGARIDTIASILSLIVFTIAALIFTNVAPKQVGFDHADAIAMASARPFRILIRLTRPIAWLVSATSHVFERIINRKRPIGVRVTESDLLSLVAEGIRIGALDKRETQFVRNALKLSDLKVSDVMTPLTEVEVIDFAWPISKVDQFIRSSQHSYFPVLSSEVDGTFGLIKARQWLAASNPPTRLVEMLREIESISSSASAIELFEALRSHDSRIVLVGDVDRSVIGIVTLNDAVRLIAGELAAIED